MRIFVVIILAAHCLLAGAARGQKVTLAGRGLSLHAVLASIKKQTGYAVFAPKEILDKARPVTLRVKNMPLVAALDIITRELSLRYEISSKTIFLSSYEADEKQPLPSFQEGYVISAEGKPVEGATISARNGTIITAADQLGYFRIAAVKGEVLQISSVGYISKEWKAPAEGKVNIVLEIQPSDLDETTIVAYGTVTRREVTGAVSAIKSREFAGVPSANLVNLLQGRAAGIDVTQVSGSPGGGGVLMMIRGYNSLDVEQGRRFSNPLWVVDGVPMNTFTSPVTGTNLLADINPDMVESIQVLKDASASSLYGSRAANGVVIVRTRRGKQNQKGTISLNVSQSFNVLPELPTITIGRGERDIRLKAFLNFPYAFVDEVNRHYRYPVSFEEIYHNPNGRIDYFQRAFSSGDAGFYFQDSLNTFYNNATNFFPLYYQVGKVLNANLQAYGGAQNVSYGLGLGWYNEDGILKGSGMDRIDGHSHLNVVIVPRLSVDVRMHASVIDRKRAEKTASLLGEPSPMIETVPNDPYLLSSLLPGAGSSVWNNIMARLGEKRETNRSWRLRSHFKLACEVTTGLTVSSMLAADYAAHRRNNFLPSFINADNFSKSTGETGINLLVLNENLVTYNTHFGTKHKVKLLAGHSYQYELEEYSGGFAMNSPSDRIFYARPGFPLLGERTYVGENGQVITESVAFQRFLSNMTEKALLSYFSRVEYAFDKRYLFTATFRTDGSSVFGEHVRWGNFPSLAAGWIFHDEENTGRRFKWLDFGKVRASWGKSGMQFSQTYLALGIMQSGSRPYQGQGVIIPDFREGLYNDQLTWEETSQVDLGIDLELLQHRLSVTGDFFYRYTDNMLMPVRLPGTYNGYLAQWRNAAAISNRGFEFLVAWEAIRGNNVNWKISVNGARTWNRFEKSYNGRDVTREETMLDAQFVLGKPLNGIFGLRTSGFVGSQDELSLYFNPRGIGSYLGRDPNIYLKPGDPKFIDRNSDGVIDERDEFYLGSALPAFSGGIGSDFKWKNFEANVLLTWQLNRRMINAVTVNSLRTDDLAHLSHPLLVDLARLRFWQQKGDEDGYSPIQFDAGSGVYDARVDRYVENVRWLKLKTIILRYSFAQLITRQLRADQLQLFATGENLLTLTNYSGMDPETVSINNGVDNGRHYPLARRFTLGITMKW